ncbi:PD-(D/E)XK nuclease family protein [Treponema sp.]|uniref:PD-(D/E)XK nuclease family protein n=1 Tax=Treponema sp. TaxID=166 RepID=UPI00388F9C5E
MTNIIEETLKKNIKNRKNRFVFPTQMAADLWADRATLTCGVSAVAMERFLAWDDFKGNSIKSKHHDKQSIPSIMRTVFSTLLLEENKKTPFLKKIIGSEFSKEANGFTDWITSLLPSLSLWKKHLESSSIEMDEEDQDLIEIYSRYKAFLDKNDFFDPAWETPPFESDGNHYFIFFPEILSDYAEYKEILETTEDIDIVNIPQECLPSISETEKLPDADFYPDSRSELKNIALKLRKIHEEKKIDWQDIAISVPDIESYGRYIERELELYRIPCVIRFARPLDYSGAGNFFSQAKECVTSNFTFNSVRDLLLNLELPWNDNESINQLIEFGKKNNCICSYHYDGNDIDIWEESFKTTATEYRAMEFYRALKKHLTALVNAPKFTDIRDEYFKFRNFAFNMEKCSHSADTIISRCISELGSLIDIETAYPQYELPSPFSFFIDHLSSTKYLEQTDNLGVRVLSYKTAACAPFACHVVIDASQSNLNVIYKTFSFLREDKRKKIFRNQEDPNVTQHFVMLYTMNSLQEEPLFSAASKTFTGYSQICSYLNEHEVKNEDLLEGFYDKEKKWFQESNKRFDSIKEITDISKEGLEFWKTSHDLTECEENDSVLSSKTQEIIDNKFRTNKSKGKIMISASSLKKFYCCPRLWLEQYIAELDEPINEATLIDRYAQGKLNHKVLELYFKGLKKNDLPIHTTENGLMDNYKTILETAIDEAIEKMTRTPVNPKGNSFIAAELINATKNVLHENMLSAIESFSRQFEGFSVLYAEEDFVYEEVEKGYVLEGTVDLIISDGQEEFIIDYKNSSVPGILYSDELQAPAMNRDYEDEELSISASEDFDTSNLPDFQMPAYLYLLEKTKNVKATNCAFFSLKKHELVPVIGEKVFEIFKSQHPKTNIKVYKREDFEPTMNVFHQKTEEFFNRVKELNFSVTQEEQDFDRCNSCTFRAFCRRVFNVSRKD